MFLQDNDPYHLHAEPNYIYLYLILAPIMMAVVFYATWKLMTFLDSRRDRADEKNRQGRPAKNTGKFNERI